MPKTAAPWTFHYAGDRCLILEFGKTIERSLVDQVVSLNAKISAAILSDSIQGIRECIPTFRSLAVMYDPLIIHPKELIDQLRNLGSEPVQTVKAQGRQFTIPVHYGEESGPDLQNVSELTDLDAENVIALHENTVFTVYMLGFLPGFAFLGDTPPELHLPRRSEPRVRVPAGSVAIAMQLTGVYPWDSPGGWHILGRSPIPLFDGHRSPPTLFTAGDSISFRSISLEEYNEIQEQKTLGTFDVASLEAEADTKA